MYVRASFRFQLCITIQRMGLVFRMVYVIRTPSRTHYRRMLFESAFYVRYYLKAQNMNHRMEGCKLLPLDDFRNTFLFIETVTSSLCLLFVYLEVITMT